jgi:plastocyanin
VNSLLTRVAVTLAIALIVPSAAAAVPRGGEPLGTVQRIRMVDGNQFRPQRVTISRGTRVRWINRDNVSHTTTGSTWDETLSPGERFSRRFRRAGTFPYECTIHFGMTGRIVVN